MANSHKYLDLWHKSQSLKIVQFICMLLLWIVCASWINKRQWYKQPFSIVCVKAERFVLRLKSSFSAERCWHGWYYHLRKLNNGTASKHSSIPLRWRGSQLHSGLFLLEQPKCQHTATVCSHTSIPMAYHSFISLHSACVFLYFQGPAGKDGPPGSPGAAGEKVWTPRAKKKKNRHLTLLPKFCTFLL